MKTNNKSKFSAFLLATASTVVLLSADVSAVPATYEFGGSDYLATEYKHNYDEGQVYNILTKRLATAGRLGAVSVVRHANIIPEEVDMLVTKVKEAISESNGKKIIAMPLNAGSKRDGGGSSHWVGLEIRIAEDNKITAIYQDPLSINHSPASIARAAVVAKAMKEVGATLITMDVKQQVNDNTSCGAFTIENFVISTGLDVNGNLKEALNTEFANIKTSGIKDVIVSHNVIAQTFLSTENQKLLDEDEKFTWLTTLVRDTKGEQQKKARTELDSIEKAKKAIAAQKAQEYLVAQAKEAQKKQEAASVQAAKDLQAKFDTESAEEKEKQEAASVQAAKELQAKLDTELAKEKEARVAAEALKGKDGANQARLKASELAKKARQTQEAQEAQEAASVQAAKDLQAKFDAEFAKEKEEQEAKDAEKAKDLQAKFDAELAKDKAAQNVTFAAQKEVVGATEATTRAGIETEEEKAVVEIVKAKEVIVAQAEREQRKKAAITELVSEEAEMRQKLEDEIEQEFKDEATKFIKDKEEILDNESECNKKLFNMSGEWDGIPTSSRNAQTEREKAKAERAAAAKSSAPVLTEAERAAADAKKAELAKKAADAAKAKKVADAAKLKETQRLAQEAAEVKKFEDEEAPLTKAIKDEEDAAFKDIQARVAASKEAAGLKETQRLAQEAAAKAKKLADAVAAKEAKIKQIKRARPEAAKEAAKLAASMVEDRMAEFELPVGIAAGEVDQFKMQGAWVRGNYGVSKQGKIKDISGYKGKMVGVTAGVDFLINEEHILGISYSNVHAQFKYKQDRVGDKLTSKNHIISLYNMYHINDNLTLKSMLSAGMGKMNNKDFNPDTKITATGKNKNKSYNAQTALHYKIKQGENLFFVPNVGLKYAHYKDTAYTTRANGADVDSFDAKSNNVLSAVVGVNAMMSHKLSNNLTLVPSLHASVESRLHEKVQKVAAEISPTTGEPIEASGASKASRFSYNIGGGLTAKYDNVEISANYNCNLQKKYQGHQGSLRLKLSF